MAATGRVLVYGGRGALGSQCVRYFKSRNWVSAGPGGGQPGARESGRAASGVCESGPVTCRFFSPPQWVASIDLAENEEASANVVVGATESFPEQAEQVGPRPGQAAESDFSQPLPLRLCLPPLAAVGPAVGMGPASGEGARPAAVLLPFWEPEGPTSVLSLLFFSP